MKTFLLYKNPMKKMKWQVREKDWKFTNYVIYQTPITRLGST